MFVFPNAHWIFASQPCLHLKPSSVDDLGSNVYLFPWLHENFLLMTYAFEGEIQRFGCGPPCHVSIGENDCPQPDMLEKRSVVSSISDFLTQQLRLPWEEKKTFVEGVKTTGPSVFLETRFSKWLLHKKKKRNGRKKA